MKRQICAFVTSAMLFGCAGVAGMAARSDASERNTTPPAAEQAAQTQTISREEENLLYASSAEATPDVSTDYISPLVTLRADPFLFKKDGKYYFTGSYPEYDRIEITCADSVNGIAAAVPKTIWTMPDKVGEAYVWAPEIHYVMGEWVVYYTYSIDSLWDIRSCALRCKGDDPMHDDWENLGLMQTSDGDDFSFRTWGFSLDMTVYENGGHWYCLWAQKDPESNIYLAELETPYKLKSKPVLLTKPEYDWERNRENVDEGPGVFRHAGKIYVTFSGGATGYEYCMGLLEIDASADPLVKENWKKYDKPVFSTNEEMKIYGPGHNNFVEGDNGELLCIMHFRDYKEIIGGNGNSLYDFNRHAHVMKVQFDETGKPVFAFDEDDLYNSQFTDHGKD